MDVLILIQKQNLRNPLKTISKNKDNDEDVEEEKNNYFMFSI